MKHGAARAFVLLCVILAAAVLAQTYPDHPPTLGVLAAGGTIFGSFIVAVLLGTIILVTVLHPG